MELPERENLLQNLTDHFRSVPEFPSFRDLAWEDQEWIQVWFSSYHLGISEVTFTNLFAWRLSRPVRISRKGEFLLVARYHGPEEATLLPPVGEGSLKDVMMGIFDRWDEVFAGKPKAFERLPESLAGEIRDARVTLEEDRPNFDYVYLVSDLANLEGRRFDGKRNWVKRCLENYGCTYLPITPENVSLCLDLQEEWCNIRHCEVYPGLASEFEAIRETFERFFDLSIFGGAVSVSGKVEAFEIAERLSGDTAVVHFEKANPEIPGLYQVINQWFSQNALGDFQFVNREQDLGVEGLRKAKMSYHPHHFVKKYIVRRE